MKQYMHILFLQQAYFYELDSSSIVFLSGDQAVDYHGVFRWRICSGSGKKIYFFLYSLQSFIQILQSGSLLYLRSKTLSPSFHIFLIYFLISFPLLSYAQGLLKRHTLLQY